MSQAKSCQDLKIYKRSCCKSTRFQHGDCQSWLLERKRIVEFILQIITNPNCILCVKKIPKHYLGSNLLGPACLLVYSTSWPMHDFCLLINSHNLNNIGIPFLGILLASQNWLMLHKVCLRGKKVITFFFNFPFHNFTNLYHSAIYWSKCAFSTVAKQNQSLCWPQENHQISL